MSQSPQTFPPPIKLLASRNLERVWWSGRWHYLAAPGTEESRKKYAELLWRITAGDLPPPPSSSKSVRVSSVADVLARWLAEEGPAVCTERGGELTAFAQSFQPMERLYGDLPAAEFGPDQYRALRRACCDGSWMTPEDAAKRRGPPGWSRKVVNQRLGRIKRAWAWAEESGLVPRGSCAALAVVGPLRRGTALAREGPGVQSTTLADVLVVRRELCRRRCHAAAALLLVQWWTGARTAELRIMRAGDVACAHNAHNALYTPRQHKTDRLGHHRAVPLGPRAWAVLGPRLRGLGPDDWVFPVSRGKARPRPYSCRAYSKLIRAVALACGLPRFRPYGSRHATKDRLCRAEGPEAARHVLGHASLATTEKYGARLDVKYASEVQRRLG